MQRLIRLSLFSMLFCLLGVTFAYSQSPIVQVSGRVKVGDVRIFQKDTTYVINNEYVVGGTLIIEPGTTVYFYPNGRLIDSTGGRIIADGFAKATYNQSPNGINPVLDYQPLGYADFDYFFYGAVNQYNDNSSAARTIRIETPKDPTVHKDKYNYIFHVLLDKANRRIVDLQDPLSYAKERNTTNGDMVLVSFEQAMMFNNARIANYQMDPNIKILPWTRVGGQNVNNVNVVPEKINFIGKPVGNFSREWGHIVVLPGARAAFFRNVNFENIRKDTTVDRQEYYLNTTPQYTALNKRMTALTNGAGGAITTFSSRTWLIDVTFKNNFARNRGGALNILQTPKELEFMAGGYTANSLGYYPADKNPQITNKNGTPSVVNNNTIIRTDNIDEATSEPMVDANRQAFDDGRLSVFLGRMRRLTFENNKTLLAFTKEQVTGDGKVTYDKLDQAADYPYSTGNHANGGAIYIAGVNEYRERVIEVGFGVNDSIKIGDAGEKFPEADYFIARGNEAVNYQQALASEGARGGAIYAGKYTSLIIAGEFTNNRTYATYFDSTGLWGLNSSLYSQGGAVFTENTLARLQVRGGPQRVDNPTYFTGNRAGAGGALFVDGNVSDLESPVIGGSDSTITTRFYGQDIKFTNNHALTFGGAVLSKRHMSINGSGGVVENTKLGYDGKYAVIFRDNTAGFSGGAIDIRIPSAIPPLPPFKRAVQIVRAEFNNNTVGKDIVGNNMTEIRGGGAIYSYNGDMRLVKATDFVNNTVYHANGGALAIINPEDVNAKKFFVSDLDIIERDEFGMPINYISVNNPFTGVENEYPADVRMLTRFINNKVLNPDNDFFIDQMGSGTTQIGTGTSITPLRVLASTWINDQVGFAAGMDGLLIKFTNGGNTWQYLQSGTIYRINDILFTTPNIGFFAGDRGVIRKTTDGGNTWTTLNTGISENINDIFFVGSNTGWAVANNGYVLHTTNGGTTWTSSKPSLLNLNSIFMTTSTSGFIVGDVAEGLFTTDGVNWVFKEISGTNRDLQSVVFTSNQKGFIFGNDGVALMTENGGANWNTFNTNVTESFRSAFFVDQNNGYAVGTGGLALRTQDGGLTWTQMATNSKYGNYDIFFLNSTRGFIGGDAGMILKTTNSGSTWEKMTPANMAFQDLNRRNRDCFLPENGIGLGGAIYILDSVTATKINRLDSFNFNRVRIQNNEAFTGSAIYSDNYNLKLIFNRSLITGNLATSEIGMTQNVVQGPVDKDNGGNIIRNFASHDMAGATIYGEVQGPLPNRFFSDAANSIYDNDARFLIRLPDAPNTKGILAGTTGIGYGGTDTLRGNYWGASEANVNFRLPHLKDDLTVMETFFVAGDGNTWLGMVYPELINNNPADPRQQGPFESLERGDVTYKPIDLTNVTGDQTTADPASIPEKLLMSGRIYDMYDKSTDIKTADYSKRRMSPIEDFAVGIPPRLRLFTDSMQPSYNRVIKRWVRDPYYAELKTPEGNFIYPGLNLVQGEFKADRMGVYYHPVGYPLYLETKVDYDGLMRESNHDPLTRNESVFFVINLKTGDYIRANLAQVDENAPYRETFRKTIELVPDSTFRSDPTYRRTSEGLANLGSGPELLTNLYRNALNEDLGTLQGRRYTADDNALARVTNLFSNRPDMPASNLIAGISNTTYYAGERYNALPVRVGDSVLIVSRTILWREGIHEATLKGLSFRVVESTEPPEWTGNIVTLQTDTIVNYFPSEKDPNVKEKVVYTEFLNKIFLTEDRPYPVSFRTYSGLPLYGDESGQGGKGRDSILRVTAIDWNGFYDPRSFLDPTKYARLEYDWQVDPNSALSKWLVVRRNFASSTPVWGAAGYLELAGRPINPFVVPGGEEVLVTAANYPVNYRNVDALKSMGVPQDTIDRWVETFPSYFSNQNYDEENARFLQQDTINTGSHNSINYAFKIFVVDSLPRFLEEGYDEEIKRIDDENQTYVHYVGTQIKCGRDRFGKIVANLTDKLRFQMDINTDDELEDKSPAAAGWDFRYGRTAYGFLNYSIRQNPNDTTIVDTLHYHGDSLVPSGRLVQSRPQWMDVQYLMKYDSDTELDNFGVDFTTNGQLNYRIPRDIALELLKPQPQYNNGYNTDTVFTIVVNDGHGGINNMKYELLVNFQPEITNVDSLPYAVEDRDYNPTLTDPRKQIHVTDPNFGQKHTFKLIYATSPETQIFYDNCYPEAGSFDLTNHKTTPDWLKINPTTGILYGTPRVHDAPKIVQVTVVVTDENGLSNVKILNMEVQGVSHQPYLVALPTAMCLDESTNYSTTIKIIDTDLLRTNPMDTIRIELFDLNNNPMTGLVVNPSFVVSNGLTDTAIVTLTKTGVLNRDPGSPYVTVNIVIKDRWGESFTFIYKLLYSEAVSFAAPIRVTNARGAYQDLIFGTSPFNRTTTGDSKDGAPAGTLDELLCEIELPPRPATDVFDARWMLPLREGTLRNFFPEATVGTNNTFEYQGRFQAGSLGATSPLYPVTLSWNPQDVPSKTDEERNPAGSTWWLKDFTTDGNKFIINMNDPSKYYHNNNVSFTYSDTLATLTVIDHGIEYFRIVHDWISSVTSGENNPTSTRIVKVTPNPVSVNTIVTYELTQSAKTTIQVVDMLGNIVVTLLDDNRTDGTYSLNWNGKDVNGNELANGQYMIRLVVGNTISTYPVVVVK